MKEEPFAVKIRGKQVVGMIHYARKDSPVAIICHGWFSHKLLPRFLLYAARKMAESGITAIRFDFRGSGESEGRWEDQTITSMLEDLDAVINFATNKLGNRKICVIGRSQGAYIAFLKAARNKRINCLVSWMGRMWDYEDLKLALEEYKRKGYIYTSWARISGKYVRDSLKYRLKTEVKKIRTPALFIYGEKDDTVYPSSCLTIYRKLKAQKKLLIFNDLDHFFNGKDSKKLLKETIAWIKRYC